MSNHLTAATRKIADKLWADSEENLPAALKLMDADQTIKITDEHAIEGRLNFLNDRRADIGVIALSRLKIKSLETQSSDELDFHELSVWDIKKALEQAFMAGRRSK